MTATSIGNSLVAQSNRPKRRWLGLLLELLFAILGWLLLWPLTLIVPRDRKLIVFFGRDGGKFIDNCKHLFARATERADLGIEPVYLAVDQELRDWLRAQGARAELVSSLRGTWSWLRAGTIVVDNVDWRRGMRFSAARGARIVQLWHGVPLKKVELGRIRERLPSQPRWERVLFTVYLWVAGRLATLDWFLGTSRYVTACAFANSFRYRNLSNAGYPRNDVLFGPGNILAEAYIDSCAKALVAQHRARPGAGPVGLYAPTFREAMGDPFSSGSIDLPALSRAAVDLDVLLLVKLHPWMQGRIRSMELPGILLVTADSDVYPLLREMEFLITDYSSIFFDYLLLDRPILFFPYDLDRYLSHERPMYFDYAQMTPGPKSTSIDGLIAKLESVVAGDDDWRDERARVRSLVFDHLDGHASDRLLDELLG